MMSLGPPGRSRHLLTTLSNWYFRRSRRRFWKSDSDSDKKAAYATLYEALVTVSKLLSPTMPFIADELYLNLVESLMKNPLNLFTWPIGQNMIPE